MPYNSIQELPESVKNALPQHALDIYKEAFNSAYDQYDKPDQRRGDADREETAHRVAWSAVKRAGYKKGDDGKWHQSS
jgi:cation transport regulator